MFLEELIIYSYKDEKILRRYKFNKVGVSIILGEKDRKRIEGDSNGVGKTTLVEIIRCLFGQKFKNKFIKSSELVDNKLFAYLKCNLKNEILFFGKKLYEQDGYILRANEINYDLSVWKQYEENEYKNKMNEILIHNDNGIYNISLGSLNEYLFRDEVEGFIDIFRANRNSGTSTACLMYLAKLPYWLEMDINTIKNKIADLRAQKKYIDSLKNEIADIRLKKKILEKEINELNLDVENLKFTNNLNKHEEEYKIVREEYSNLKKKIIKKQRQKKQYLNNLKSLGQNKEDSLRLLDLEGFYKELIKYFPDELVKSYEDVADFYLFMNNNRGNVYNKNIEELDNDIKAMEVKIDKLENIMSNYSNLINTVDFKGNYNNLTNEINERYKELSEIEFKINLYDSRKEINDEINTHTADILSKNIKLKEIFDEYTTTVKNIVDDFEEMVSVSYNVQGELELEYNNSTDGRSNTGRIIINSRIPDEESHGIKTMKIMIFDLACLLSRLRKNDELEFLIHDGGMTIPDNKKAKYNLINYIDSKLKNMKSGQYIITTNVSDFTSKQISSFYTRKYVVGVLDKREDTKRCLGIKFVTK